MARSNEALYISRKIDVEKFVTRLILQEGDLEFKGGFKQAE